MPEMSKVDCPSETTRWLHFHAFGALPIEKPLNSPLDIHNETAEQPSRSKSENMIQQSTPKERFLKLKVNECMVDSLTRFLKIVLDSLGFSKIHLQTKKKTKRIPEPQATSPITGNQSHRQPVLQQATSPTTGNQCHGQPVLQATEPQATSPSSQDLLGFCRIL